MYLIFYRAIGAHLLALRPGFSLVQLSSSAWIPMRQDSDESVQWEPQESEAIIYDITQIP
jgi:hypothetical protein